jgi:Flp pilus assembly protein TadD
MISSSPSARSLAACAVEAATAGAPSLGAWLFDEAGSLEPETGEFHAGRIACLLDAQRPEAALEELQRLDSLATIVPRRSTLLAATLMDVGRADEALPIARSAVGENPSDAQAHLVLAQAEMAGGHLESAASAAEESVRLEPLVPQTHLARAQIASQLNRPEDAIRSLRRAAALDPENPDLRTALASSLLHTGEREEAQRHLVQVVARHPHHAAAEQALLSSHLSARPGPPRWLVLFLGLLPLIGGGIGLAVGTVTGQLPDAMWAGLLPGILIQQIGFLLIRRQTPPEVADWIRHTKRRVHRRATTPLLRMLPGLSLTALVLSVLLAILTLPGTPAGQVMGFAFLLFCFFMVLAIVIFGARSRARHSAPPEPPKPVLDTSVCNCPHVRYVEGHAAEQYATDHLKSSGRRLMAGVGILECPVLGTPWLWFSEDVGAEAQVLPALLRVSPESLEPGT